MYLAPSYHILLRKVVSTGVGAVGLWARDAAYWKRSRWAGRRELDGVAVVDGVVTNPLAHATATALAIAGATGARDVTQVTTDLYRAKFHST